MLIALGPDALANADAVARFIGTDEAALHDWIADGLYCADRARDARQALFALILLRELQATTVAPHRLATIADAIIDWRAGRRTAIPPQTVAVVVGGRVEVITDTARIGRAMIERGSEPGALVSLVIPLAAIEIKAGLATRFLETSAATPAAVH
ncbi:MAG: hypothetical protein RLO50_14495 [Azospirillaceae bacterium]